MTLTFNPGQAMVLTPTNTHKTRVQKYIGSKDRVETNKQTDRRTDAIDFILFRLTRSVTMKTAVT